MVRFFCNYFVKMIDDNNQTKDQKYVIEKKRYSVF